MPCYHPITAYRSKYGRSETGAWPLVFNPKDGYLDHMIKIPCGQCIGCKLERSRQWAIRCVHETQMHTENCFATFTKNDAHVKSSLDKTDFQKFMKRLRKEIYPKKISYFHCGEYGENFEREHHHAILFGLDFEDKELIYDSDGIKTYTSPQLEKLWGQGFVTIGDANWDTAAYVARYCTKKITGDKAADYYKGRQPEYVTMSLKPAIGKGWYERYKSDLYNHDMCVVNDGNICKPAKYYDKLYDVDNKLHLEVIKAKRRRAASTNPEGEAGRLIEKEKCTKLKFKKLRRGFESQAVNGINNDDKYLATKNMPDLQPDITKKNPQDARIESAEAQRKRSTARTRSANILNKNSKAELKHQFDMLWKELDERYSNKSNGIDAVTSHIIKSDRISSLRAVHKT